MARGDLVSDDLIIAMFRERLGGDDTTRRRASRRLPPHRGAGGRSRRDADRPRVAAIAAVIVFDIDEETVVRRLSGRRMCRANDHVYHVESNPPAVDGVCDIDGSELYQRDDDQPDVIRTRFRKQWVEAAAPVIDYYRGHGVVTQHRRRAAARARCRRRSTRCSTGSGGGRDRPQDRRRGRHDGPRRPRGRRHARPGRGERRARRDAGRARPHRRDFIDVARRPADLQGLPRLPGVDLRVAERDGGARHPRPVHARRGRPALDRRRRHPGRLRRRLGDHLHDRRSRPRRPPT